MSDFSLAHSNSLDVLPMLSAYEGHINAQYLLPHKSWSLFQNDKIAEKLKENILNRLEHCPLFQQHPYFVFMGTGYNGDGAFPIGFTSSDPEIEAMYHEIGHAFEFQEGLGAKRASSRFKRNFWGMRITTEIEVAGRLYAEPVTYQATEREARVMGIQLRLMEMNGLPYDGKSFEVLLEDQAISLAGTLNKFMPDYISNPEFKVGESQSKEPSKAQLYIAGKIIESYTSWTEDKILSMWKEIAPQMTQLALKNRLEIQKQYQKQYERQNIPSNKAVLKIK